MAGPGDRSERCVGVCVDEQEIWIAASPEVVWRKGLHEVNTWWKANLKPGSLGVFLEPWVGGRFWQKFDEDGHGVLYGTVAYLNPPKALHIVNAFGMAGAAVWTNTWRFSDVDDGTLMEYHNQIMAVMPDRYMSGSFKAMTRAMLESLKRFVETGEVDEPAAARAED